MAPRQEAIGTQLSRLNSTWVGIGRGSALLLLFVLLAMFGLDYRYHGFVSVLLVQSVVLMVISLARRLSGEFARLLLRISAALLIGYAALTSVTSELPADAKQTASHSKHPIALPPTEATSVPGTTEAQKPSGAHLAEAGGSESRSSVNRQHSTPGVKTTTHSAQCTGGTGS